MRFPHRVHPSCRAAFLVAVVVTTALTDSLVNAQTNCEAPADWFPTTPAPAWTIEDAGAADGRGFHQWSWQTFLWLNQPSASGGTNLSRLRYASELHGSGPRLNARVTKGHEATSIDQAMSSVLVDQEGQVVYYTAQLNDLQFAAIKKFANTSADLARNSKNPAIGYPTGALEVKAAWRVASMTTNGKVKVFIPNAAQRFLTFRDTVAPIKWEKDGNGYQPVSNHNVPGLPAELAMVGFHIIGRTTNHPEFVWATFEHVDNAPLRLRMFTSSEIGGAISEGTQPMAPWCEARSSTPPQLSASAFTADLQGRTARLYQHLQTTSGPTLLLTHKVYAAPSRINSINSWVASFPAV